MAVTARRSSMISCFIAAYSSSTMLFCRGSDAITISSSPVSNISDHGSHFSQKSSLETPPLAIDRNRVVDRLSRILVERKQLSALVGGIQHSPHFASRAVVEDILGGAKAQSPFELATEEVFTD